MSESKPVIKTPPATVHDYLSTACFHGLHDRCRLTCKFCAVPCRCPCHGSEPKPEPTVPVSVLRALVKKWNDIPFAEEEVRECADELGALLPAEEP
jgi:hypothetical protein